MSNKKTRNITDLKPVLKKALEEYEPDIMKDTESNYLLKKKVQELGEVDRIILLLYAELQSYTEMAKVLGVSRSTIFWQVRRIKEELQGKSFKS